MQELTDKRTPSTPDQLWLLQHPAVFTLGQAGKPEHILNPGEIPIVNSDRGGQVTYHGPGQLIAYTMIDLRRARLGVRGLVTQLESAVIGLLAKYAIQANASNDAPGVYIDGAKVASLGLRVRKGCSYHGLSLNIDMDLEPFTRINPCGYPGLAVTQLTELGVKSDLPSLGRELAQQLAAGLGYTLSFTDPDADKLDE
ncbi:MAG: lipoyl(octanoyl) transferase LipB [Candidatus Thiodiazotropha weberae]|nr:lipoyl(octanoyl) transferase LipB [Candidatus Thiodiazotropha weberae]